MENETFKELLDSIESENYATPEGVGLNEKELPSIRKAIKLHKWITAGGWMMNADAKNYNCIAGPLSQNARWDELRYRVWGLMP